MKRFLSVVLAVAMVLSLAASYTISFSATALSGADTLEVGKAAAAPDVTDGVRDAQYTKVFDMSGPDCYDNVLDEETGTYIDKINDHFPIGFNSNERRYDKAAHPAEEDSDWYNTRAQGYMCWDSTALYLFVEITGMGTLDDNPAVKWEGDGMQFAIYTSRGTVETTFATSNGEIVALNNVNMGAESSLIKVKNLYGIIPSGAETANVPEGIITQKADGTVVYEMKLEWKGLGLKNAPTVDSTYPFNLTINMNDSNMVTEAFCGFQIGTGIFNESSSTHGGVQQSCKFKLVETVSHTHTDADGLWETDGTYHWHTCACGEVFDKVAHSGGTATCVDKAVCSVCNSAYGEVNSSNHVHTETINASPASCENPGYTGDTYCNDCHQTIEYGTTIPAPGHTDADGLWETDGTNHWHTCACGEEFDKAAHSGGTANCHTKAVCATCDASYGEFDSTNHDGGTEIRDDAPASCNTPGYTGDTYCLGCGAKIGSGTIIPATGAHVDADGEWETDGTNHWHTCACGEEFDKVAHSGGTANCHTKAVCAICDASYGEFDAANHDGGTEIRDNAPASCNTPGYTGDTYCLGCGAKIGSGTTIPSTGAHVDADGEWETDGTNHWHTCACGEEFDKEAHSGGTATCHAKAVCATCDASYGELNAANHDGGTEVRDAVDATCISAGYTGDTYCLGCGAKLETGTAVPVDTLAVKTSIEKIIAYLDNVQDPVRSGKTITELLTETLAAYLAAPSETTLNEIISAWDSWTYGGHDAHDVFFTDKLLSYIDMFPKQADGSNYIEKGAAKRTPDQLLEHIKAVDPDEYWSFAPSDFIDGTVSTELADGDVASAKLMNEAETASEACKILYDMLDFIEENCELTASVMCRNVVDMAELISQITTGDPELRELLVELVEIAKEELESTDPYGYASYPRCGFVQYRPAGQADSFTEDVEIYSSRYDGLMGDVGDILSAYGETVPAPVFTKGDGSVWTKGSTDGLKFESDALFELCFGLLVDDENLDGNVGDDDIAPLDARVDDESIDSESFKAVKTENGVAVELKAEYLETLAVGKHTLTLGTLYGEAEAEFEVKAAPLNPGDPGDPEDPGKPGKPDNTSDLDMGVWFLMMLVSAGMITVALTAKKRFER